MRRLPAGWVRRTQPPDSRVLISLLTADREIPNRSAIWEGWRGPWASSDLRTVNWNAVRPWRRAHSRWNIIVSMTSALRASHTASDSPAESGRAIFARIIPGPR